jgi:hypothetical protein
VCATSFKANSHTSDRNFWLHILPLLFAGGKLLGPLLGFSLPGLGRLGSAPRHVRLEVRLPSRARKTALFLLVFLLLLHGGLRVPLAALLSESTRWAKRKGCTDQDGANSSSGSADNTKSGRHGLPLKFPSLGVGGRATLV